MEKKDLKKIQSFRIVNGNLIIRSNSGNEYRITKTTCSCKGFGFHRTCSHLKEAEEQGILKLLDESTSSFNFKRSPAMILSRKDCLRKYLQKHNVSFTEEVICKIEPKITSTMKPEELLNLVG